MVRDVTNTTTTVSSGKTVVLTVEASKPRVPLIRIFDRHAKKFLRGEWELEHAISVLNFLVDNPDKAHRFGYDK